MAENGTFIVVFLLAVWLIISLCFAIPTAISASRRGMNPLGWGALTFFTWVVGLIIFLICIKPKCDDVKCPACGGMIPKIHVYCPFCGHKD